MHLGIVRAKDGSDKARFTAINLIFGNRVRFKYEQAVHTATSYRATKGIKKR